MNIPNPQLTTIIKIVKVFSNESIRDFLEEKLQYNTILLTVTPYRFRTFLH
jgi:hypothetical protein